VKPIKEAELKLPGSEMKTPNSYEFYLEGRLEGRRDGINKHGPEDHFILQNTPNSQISGLEGTFGYQPVQETQKEERQ